MRKLRGARQREEVAERDARDHEPGREDDEVLQHPLVPWVEGRDEERPHLPEDHRQREQEAGVHAHPHRGDERLPGAERQQLPVLVGKREDQPVDDPVMEDEADDRAGDQGAEARRTSAAAALRGARRAWPRRRDSGGAAAARGGS